MSAEGWNVGALVQETTSGFVGRIYRVDVAPSYDPHGRTWFEVEWFPSMLSDDDLDSYALCPEERETFG